MNGFSGFDEAAVVDVETTGLDPSSDRIISVAVVRARFADLRENPDGLHGTTMDVVVNPQCRIPRDASRVHGFTDSDVADKGPFSDVAQQFRDFIGDLPVIGHNVSFDKRFLSSEFKRAGVKTLARNKSFCTMRRFQDFNHGRQRGSNLDNVVEVLGVKGRKSSKHDALEDAQMTFHVAGLFYMMDNRIRIPGGKPTPPSRTQRPNSDWTNGKQDHDSPASGIGAIVTVVVVVAILIWWLS